ncbi:MAG: family 20 glycosylhydrolase [Bacteroidales bacterium]|nr:family 20 glycosylhydrolase [Candidatus Cryptobacteroides fimicaballi]
MAKRIIILLFSAFAVLSCTVNDVDRTVGVIPQPHHISMPEKAGSFVLDRDCAIFLDEPTEEMYRIAGFLNEKLKKAAGFTLPVKEVNLTPKARGIYFMNAGNPSEAYNLHIMPDMAVVDYGDGAGAFYALQTMFQLLPNQIFASSVQKGVKWNMTCCDIEDSPRFKYRGMHLDVCLHFFDIDFLKRYIDLMALHKVNRFHWHLTEDQGWRLEIKKYPLLTQKGQWRKETVIGSLKSGIYDGKPHGGYYSQEQVRELVKYAAERYVTIIPEIELPGHALAAIACYPELSCGLDSTYEVATKWGVFKQVYCPKEETFKFLEDVFDEVFELFPSKLVHIGGDECPKASWKKCPHCQALIRKLGLKDEFELQSWFVTRMEKYINSKGREIIGWDEILQGGLAPNAKVMSWLGEEGGIKAAQQHHEVVMSPHYRYYLDYWQADPDSEPLAMGGPTTLRTMYDYNPVPEVLTDEEARYVIGVEGCVWTEYMPTPARVEYMAWPRMCAIAESGWTKAGKDWDGFASRLENHLVRLDELGVGYCDAFFNPYIEFHKDTQYDKVVTISVDAPGAEIHYTLDGSLPTADSPLYTGPFVVNRQQKVTAIAVRNGRQIGKTKYKTFLIN